MHAHTLSLNPRINIRHLYVHKNPSNKCPPASECMREAADIHLDETLL
jgi:hypothetical protein